MFQEKFKYIFGITRGQALVNGQPVVDDVNNTFTFDVATATDRLNRSDSGLWLDEMDDLPLNKVPIELNPETGQPVAGSIWEMAVLSRHNALKELETSIRAGMGTIHKLKYEPYSGVLGNESTRGYKTLTDGQTVTTTIQTNQVPGNFIYIKSIGLHTSLDTTVPVTINGQVVEIKTRANRLYKNILETPLQIPIDGEDIVIEYEVDGFLVGDNKMCYSCAGVARKLSPYFPNIQDQEGNGLVIDAMISCNPDRVVFENYAVNEGIKNVLAYAARYKTAEYLIERIINSNQISRFTMTEQQPLHGKRNHFRKEYQDRINWLISEDGFDLTMDNCYQCKQVQGFRKRGILS